MKALNYDYAPVLPAETSHALRSEYIAGTIDEFLTSDDRDTILIDSSGDVLAPSRYAVLLSGFSHIENVESALASNPTGAFAIRRMPVSTNGGVREWVLHFGLVHLTDDLEEIIRVTTETGRTSYYDYSDQRDQVIIYSERVH